MLADYFHVDVHLAMGLTDVDDKIIARARGSGFAGGPRVNMTENGRRSTEN